MSIAVWYKTPARIDGCRRANSCLPSNSDAGQTVCLSPPYHCKSIRIGPDSRTANPMGVAVSERSTQGEVTDDASVRAPFANDIGRLARRGAKWSVVLAVSRQIIGLGTTAVLARYLSPTDFGLLGMVATLTVFLQVFSEMGLSWAAVQRADLTRRQVDNLFWVNALFGGLLWSACALAVPLLNHFYGRRDLGPIAIAMGASFVISSLAVQPMALMKRQMSFKALSLIEIVSTLSGTATGIAMALMRYGYWALVGQAIAVQAVRLVLLFGVTRYRPGWPKRDAGTASLLKFGGYLAAYGIVNYFARNLDNVLVGKAWGAEQLGYYTRAYFLMTLPTMLATGSMMDVMVPALSVFRDDRQRMGDAYRRAVRMIAFVAIPLSIGLAVTAPEAVRLVYGPKWLPIVPMLMWLSLASVSQPIHNTMGWLFVTSGHTRAMFIWGAVAAIVLAAGFWIGLPWGGTGVACAYALVMTFVLTLPALYLAHRSAGLQLRETLMPLVPILLCGLAMGTAAWAAGYMAHAAGLHWLLTLAAKGVVGAVVYAALVITYVKPSPLGTGTLFHRGRTQPGEAV